MKYKLVKRNAVVVDVPSINRNDPGYIPQVIYDACWWDRFWNRWVMVEQFDEKGNENIIFYWPARKMTPPEVKREEWLLSCTKQDSYTKQSRS